MVNFESRYLSQKNKFKNKNIKYIKTTQKAKNVYDITIRLSRAPGAQTGQNTGGKRPKKTLRKGKNRLFSP